MSFQLQPRKIQTKVKHYILEKYIKILGRNNSEWTCPKKVKRAHFVYVDCNAYAGIYSGELEDHVMNASNIQHVFGSPIIGVQALEELRKNRTRKEHLFNNKRDPD